MVIYATVIQIVRSDMKRNSNIAVKNPLTKNCNTILDTTKKVCHFN